MMEQRKKGLVDRITLAGMILVALVSLGCKAGKPGGPSAKEGESLAALGAKAVEIMRNAERDVPYKPVQIRKALGEVVVAERVTLLTGNEAQEQLDALKAKMVKTLDGYLAAERERRGSTRNVERRRFEAKWGGSGPPATGEAFLSKLYYVCSRAKDAEALSLQLKWNPSFDKRRKEAGISEQDLASGLELRMKARKVAQETEKLNRRRKSYLATLKHSLLRLKAHVEVTIGESSPSRVTDKLREAERIITNNKRLGEWEEGSFHPKLWAQAGDGTSIGRDAAFLANLAGIELVFDKDPRKQADAYDAIPGYSEGYATVRQGIEPEFAASMIEVYKMLLANLAVIEKAQKAVAEINREIEKRGPVGQTYRAGYAMGTTVRRKNLGKPHLLRILERTAMDDGLKFGEKAGYGRRNQGFMQGYVHGVTGQPNRYR